MEDKPKRWGRAVAKGFGVFVVLLFVFGIGINVGNGNISWESKGVVSSDLPDSLDYSSVNKVYQALKDNYDGKLTTEQLEDGLKHGLAESTGDPYTSFFTPEEATEFQEDLNNSFSGIGAQLGKDKDGNLEVIAPIDGLPAQKAGIKAQDIIASIDGESTSDMSVDDAVSKIRGPKDTQVKLQIIRDKSETLDITVTREDIKIPSVETKTLAGNIGYIRISSFSDDTTQLVRQAAQNFTQAGVEGIVLDMRNNPGGLLNSAIEVSSLWLPRGTKVLVEKQGDKVVNTETATGSDILKGVPTVVLINGGSASASEIVAGALHDNKAAYIIGEKSYGKGVVQQLISFRDGSQLKVTVASWYRPNGQNINKKGISPDKTIELSDDATPDNDNQLQAAEAYLKQ